MKSDIEIARETPLKPIEEIAQAAGMDADRIFHYGKNIAKVDLSQIDEEKIRRHNLILVTAISPNKAGVGKTTVSIGLALGLNKIGKKAIVALREPSLGPCFGMKGGAAGGGYAQVLPMENINLHFTGDFHAITSAHNMITALLDNYIYQNRYTAEGLREVRWKRVLDVNDRCLRNIVTGMGADTDGVLRQTGFDITAASELMAILCLSRDLEDLRHRIENLLLGFTNEGAPFTVKDLGVAGAITVLLKDALLPNLVQTTEHTPAFIHGGPFANIAHGCNSVLATKMALTFGDYAITEAGFGADLGAEKFFDIKCRQTGLQPKLSVLVVTARSLKVHGGVSEKEMAQPNMEALRKGFANLDRQAAILKGFNQSVVVAFNKHADDSPEEIEAVRQHCQNELGLGFAVNEAFAKGGEGAVELAGTVVETIEKKPSGALKYAYDDQMEVKEKVTRLCRDIYGAAEVSYAGAAEKKLRQIKELGISHFPICIAKTQYSFSSDPKAFGAPSGFELKVRDIQINCGSQMIVVIMGEMMRMPGLPAKPQALHIDLVNGQIEGLS
ncbi:MAG: formate--tetrahydrofolate ligase [Bacteroides sp.]|nr:formate--tetrahydrofolate ligase [Ruminococcus flavefaciens]MCM1555417.1 formate--tetrahydrofolate ligase [Bacteroides sp.]